MLSDALVQTLKEKMKNDPSEVIKEIEHNPKILELLLNNSGEVELQKNEKIKYINLTSNMNKQLQEKSDQLKITQGLLIGAGIFLILSLLDE